MGKCLCNWIIGIQQGSYVPGRGGEQRVCRHSNRVNNLISGYYFRTNTEEKKAKVSVTAPRSSSRMSVAASRPQSRSSKTPLKRQESLELSPSPRLPQIPPQQEEQTQGRDFVLSKL